MKPMLACDWDENLVTFPVGIQPKIDGGRALTTEDGLTGRSLKKFKNRHITELFSRPEYAFLDGELAADRETHPELCRLTSSATGTIKGEPFLLWHVFDLLTPEALKEPYSIRYLMLQQHVARLQEQGLCGHLRLVPMEVVHNMEQLLCWEDHWLTMGYEGVIGRKFDAMHKQGRCTAKQGQLWRIKRFISEEAIVRKINEGDHNGNEAQTNELGKTFRSSHQENKVPNGMVGSMECEIVKDSELFKKGQIITVSKGEMTTDLAKYYFDYPEEILEKMIKFKHFPKGVKDKPRFPTWQCIVNPEDIG